MDHSTNMESNLNKKEKWNRKVEILANMKGNYEQKRQRAIHQMKLTGDQWVAMKLALGLHQKDVKTKDQYK